jgi:hypothetical protein
VVFVNNPHEVRFLNAFDEFPIRLYKNQNIKSQHHVGDLSPKTYKFHLLYFKSVLYGVCGCFMRILLCNLPIY